MTTSSMTLAAIFGLATAVAAGGNPVFIQAKPLGTDSLPSGTDVRLSSSDTSVVEVTSAEQRGNAPVGLRGKKAGTATITATATDNTGVTATLAVTVA